MRRILSFLTLFSMMATVLISAQTKKAAQSSDQLKGYVMDRMCGSKLSQYPPDQAMTKAAKHTRICALMDGCAASGYGLVLNGTWTAFDDKGSKKAEQYLRKSTAEDQLFVTVTGKLTGEKITLTAIKEAKK